MRKSTTKVKQKGLQNAPKMTSKINPKSMKFHTEFSIDFCIDFLCFWPRFWLHFGSQNRPRSLSGAKTSTIDFKQPSKHFQWFWTSEGARGVPKSTSKPPPQVDLIFCIFWLQKWPQNGAKRAPAWSQNAIKKSCKKRPPK